MAGAINAAIRGNLHRSLAKGRKELEKVIRETTGADSEPVRAAAIALAQEWRKVLNVPGSPRTASAPGAPPEADTKRLRKSIKTAVVDGVRRVGSGNYRARLHEFGYEAKDGTPVPPRPHGRVAIERAQAKMTEVLVSAAQRVVAKKKGGA